jgi:hypothetical protein
MGKAQIQVPGGLYLAGRITSTSLRACGRSAEIEFANIRSKTYRLHRDSEELDHHDNDLAFIRKMDERHASH